MNLLDLNCDVGGLEREMMNKGRRGEVESVDIDDPGEGGNFTVYINIELARSTIHRLHLQRSLHHRVTQGKLAYC